MRSQAPPFPPGGGGIPPSISEAISASFLHLQPQPLSELTRGVNPEQTATHMLHHKSENNNVLSMGNLGKFPHSIRLPTKPVAGLTPPSSPPPPVHIPSHHHPHPPHEIRGEVSVTIVGGHGGHSDAESDAEEEETGLDLSISKRRNSDEHEVSTSNQHLSRHTHKPQSPLPSDLYKRLPGLPGAPGGFPGTPASIPGFPFPFPLPPVTPGGADPAHAELLLRLARGGAPAPSPIHELPKVSAPTTSPYTVLSAMLGHHTPYPTVFPGMPPVFPSSAPNPVATAAVALASMKNEPVEKRAGRIH